MRFFSYFFPVHTDGGSYDLINDVPSPAAGGCYPPQSYLRDNWEMNYQEAAIYLQVSSLNYGIEEHCQGKKAM